MNIQINHAEIKKTENEENIINENFSNNLIGNYENLNNRDYESRRIIFENTNIPSNNILDLNLNEDKTKILKIKIFSNGKRIILKNPIVLYLTYFLIISISILFFVLM